MTQKQPKKLLQEDFDRMWGEDSPYSQVNITEQIRILDDHVSRTFLVVETDINPFTFEFAQKNRNHFVDDIPVLQLLDLAENRGKFGYVTSAGEIELRDDESRAWARKKADMAIETIIRMHALVIDTFNLKRAEPTGVIHDAIPSNARYVWNEYVGGLEIVGQGLWDTKTMVGSPAGVQNNKMRFFIVLACVKNADFKKKLAIAFAGMLKRVSTLFNVEIEDVESFQEHVLITILLPFDVAPATYTEAILKECEVGIQKPLFQKDYLVTNVKRPTPDQVASFLRQLPLDRDMRMS